MADTFDVAALEKSVSDRLQGTDWNAAKPAIPSQVPNLDERLYDDLERLSRMDFKRAAKVWEAHAPKDTVGPAFVDREYRRQISETRQIGDVLNKSLRGIHYEPNDRQNTVEPVKDKEVSVFGKAAAEAHKNLPGERDPMSLQQDQLGLRAEEKRITVGNLVEKAVEQDNANDVAERTGGTADRQSQQFTEREKNRQIALMEQVHRQFYVAGTKFHFKDQQGKLAFRDTGKRMVSALNDERVAKAMATMAEAKGWKTIKVSGHPDFRCEVWMEASMRGLEVRGYKPTEHELELLRVKRGQILHNTVAQDRTAGNRKHGPQQAERQREPVAERQVPAMAADRLAGPARRAYEGRLVEHGPASFNHAPKGKMSYFVTLETDKGEKTVWGVDLRRAMKDSQTRIGDDVKLEFRGNTSVTVEVPVRDKTGRVTGSNGIATNRNIWEVRKSEKHKVVEAVASALIDCKVADPVQREALKAAVGARLGERERAGRVPGVPVFDKAAPARTLFAERSGPVVERDSERTR